MFTHFLSSPSFSYDDQGYLHNNACSFAVVPTHSIAAIANSRVGWWILRNLGTRLQNGYLQLFVQFFERLPVPDSLSVIDADLSSMVEILREHPDPDEEARMYERLNALTEEAFGVTNEESQALRAWFDRDQTLVRSAADQPGSEDEDDV